MHELPEFFNVVIDGDTFKARPATERRLRGLAAIMDEVNADGPTLGERHAIVNRAMALAFVDCDAEGMTFAAKLNAAKSYGWASTLAEMEAVNAAAVAAAAAAPVTASKEKE